MISFDAGIREGLGREALASFPDECCGFLLGTENQAADRQVTRLLPVQNSLPGDKRRRFFIAAQDYLRAEKRAAEENLLLLGVYHSHPNHPAVPSEQDRVAAQPYFSYVIIAVLQDSISDIRSWKLDGMDQFQEESVGDYTFIRKKPLWQP
jgi:proteasome lid subunit RPN8/RPN11